MAPDDWQRSNPRLAPGSQRGQVYKAFELVDGKTLREFLHGALPVERSLGIARQVLEQTYAALKIHRL